MARKNASPEEPTPHVADDMMDERTHHAIDEALAQQVAANHAAGQSSSMGRQDRESGTLEDLQLALAESQKRTLMVQAELENFRKRIRREHAEQLRYAAIPLVRDLLPALDNFQRAMESAAPDASGSNMIEGIAMVHKMLVDVLRQHGCEQVGARGDEFNPNLHEAVGQQPDLEIPAGHVLTVTQDGYRLHDRIVRPTQVIVSSGPPDK